MADPRDNVVRLPLASAWQPVCVSGIFELPPPPEFIWDSRIVRGSVTLLGGESKIGKTFLIQQLLSCCAVGLPCLGRHTERVRVFGYFAEDSDYWLTHRQFKIDEALEINRFDYEDRYHWKSSAVDDCVLADFEYGKMRLTPEWDRLWREVEYQEIELLAIDTVGAVFQGDHFRKEKVTPFMRALQKEAITRNMAIILSIHPPTSNIRKGYAGDAAWLASARAGLSLERPLEYDPATNAPPNELLLRGIGANYSFGRSVDRLKWDEGILVADEEAPPPARTICSATRDVIDQEMLRGLQRTRATGDMVPAGWDQVGSMQRRYRKTFDNRAAWNDLNASFDRLLRAGSIVLVKVRGRCYVRPRDGFPYPEETPWQDGRP